MGLLPAAGLLLLGGTDGVLLWGRRRGPTRSARAIGIVVDIAGVGSLVVLHLVGLLLVPFGALLLAAVPAHAPH